MTISTTTNKVNAIGDGIQTNFPYNFKVTDADQMLVYIDNVLYGAAYTVNGVGDDAGGSVDIAVPPANLTVVTLYRYVDDVQETDYEPYRAFPSETVENDMDLTVMRDQQLQEQSNRTVKASVDDDGTFDYALPAMAIGHTFKVNPAGDGFVETTYDPDEAQNDSAANVALTQALWDDFDTRYLGAKAADPALDNQGSALIDGASYWNTTDKVYKLYNLGDTTWYNAAAGLESFYTPTAAPNTSGTITLDANGNLLLYNRLGRMVHISGQLLISAVAAPVGTRVNITLPFTSINTSEFGDVAGGTALFYDASTLTTIVVPCEVQGGSNNLSLHLDASLLAGLDRLSFSFIYNAA